MFCLPHKVFPELKHSLSEALKAKYGAEHNKLLICSLTGCAYVHCSICLTFIGNWCSFLGSTGWFWFSKIKTWHSSTHWAAEQKCNSKMLAIALITNSQLWNTLDTSFSKFTWEIFLYAAFRRFSWSWQFEDCLLYAESRRELLRKQSIEILSFSAFIISKIGIMLVKAFWFFFHFFCCCCLLIVHLNSKRKFLQTQAGASPASVHVHQVLPANPGSLAVAWESLIYVGFPIRFIRS